MRENGVIVVDELDELWETGQLFDRWSPGSRSARDHTNSLGISTYSGGDGALAVDAAETAGLTCPRPSPATERELSRLFELARPGNPFDLTGEVIDKPELIGPATAALIADDAFDLFLMAVPAWSGHFAKWTLGPALDEVAKQPDKRVAVSLWSAGGITAEAERLVLDAGLPLFDGSQRAVRAMGRYVDFVAGSDRWDARAADGARRRDSRSQPGVGGPRLLDVSRVAGRGRGSVQRSATGQQSGSRGGRRRPGRLPSHAQAVIVSDQPQGGGRGGPSVPSRPRKRAAGRRGDAGWWVGGRPRRRVVRAQRGDGAAGRPPGRRVRVRSSSSASAAATPRHTATSRTSAARLIRVR